MYYYDFSGPDVWPFTFGSSTGGVSSHHRYDWEEKDGEIILSISAPGLEKKGLIMNIKNDVLTIDYEPEKETSIFRPFNLRVDVGDSWQVDKIKASYKDGVLYITVPLDKPKDTVIPVTFK